MTKQDTTVDEEIAAISNVYAALKELEPEAQARVLKYVAEKLKIRDSMLGDDAASRQERSEDTSKDRKDEGATERREDASEELEGISPIAKKWMARNGLEPKKLSTIFSLGVDEIDLIAKTVPGKNKKDKMHNVFLLKGVAAYVGTGVARFTHEQVKETCLHYNAFDANNFIYNFKSLAGELSGSKDTGYTLTARGLTSATELVKSMSQTDTGD
jgi:hypothetical protein